MSRVEARGDAGQARLGRDGSRVGRGVLAGVLVLLVIMNCVAGDNENTDGSALDVSGTWKVTETVHAEGCGEGTYVEIYRLRVKQNGSKLEISSGSVKSYGTLEGNVVTWKGSVAEDGGTTTVSIRATVDGDLLSGSARWSWTDGEATCSGTSEFKARRS